ncbi:MAG: glutamine--fructose-6-phosphate transaminase (isomerizing) [Chloroflexi bacterium]|nr:glutamine--fructose-6-phosphate transaminase (isomerizing) [Chloroflexota bacterium]
MCGVIGYVGQRTALPILLDGLQHLEYRGYDSAGIALLTEEGKFTIRKTMGKLSSLLAAVADNPPGLTGIGHTRWATHGKPSAVNAHPHLDCKGEIAVIHNGIVENYMELKRELLAEGHTFVSETDTEVLPHLVERYLRYGDDLEGAVAKALGEIKGAHALMVMSRARPDRIIAARVGNAGGVIVGYGDGEMFLASDLPALLPYTQRVVFLANRELAAVTATGATYFNPQGKILGKNPQTVSYDPVAAAKGGYKHFMFKEIMEQAETVTDALRGRLAFSPPDILLEEIPFSEDKLRTINRVVLVACGTSLHAAMVGRQFIESLAHLPTQAEHASEFRYRDPVVSPDTLMISVGQSGETVDTLAAMEEAKVKGAPQITLCNVMGSQATRIADAVISLRAGLEIGVASTKTFTSSLVVLYLLAAYLGKIRGAISAEDMEALTQNLVRLPDLVGRVLEGNDQYQHLSHHFFRLANFLYLGRGINYPIALEGALKLKEVSYIHAEGYPAGEMKHGPIALIDENMPVVAIAVRDQVYDKMVNNIEQVKARDGLVIAVATEGDKEIASKADHVIYVPPTPPLLSPMVTAVPLQLLAYHIAVRRGYDVDQPRNLAKTVTVE